MKTHATVLAVRELVKPHGLDIYRENRMYIVGHPIDPDKPRDRNRLRKKIGKTELDLEIFLTKFNPADFGKLKNSPFDNSAETKEDKRTIDESGEVRCYSCAETREQCQICYELELIGRPVNFKYEADAAGNRFSVIYPAAACV
jgi:hypothetical protein